MQFSTTKVRFWLLGLFFCLGSCAQANDQNVLGLLKAASIKHDVDYHLLLAISRVESALKPYAMNVDGQSFFPDTPQQAVKILKSINDRPWMLKIRSHEGEIEQYLFSSRHEALAALNKANSLRARNKLRKISLTNSATPGKYQASLNYLDVEETGIGPMQIHYSVHGKQRGTVYKWFDPAFNIDYGAKYLKEVMDRHGHNVNGAAYYHSATPKYRNSYVQRLKKALKNSNEPSPTKPTTTYNLEKLMTVLK